MSTPSSLPLDPPLPGHRLKLWQIDSQWHCTVLGTCLTLGELRAVAAKSGVRTAAPDPSGYHVHSTMVHAASRQRTVSKALHKRLDRKYGSFIARFAKADPARLAELWAEAVSKGEVAGACWAVMTHPAADDALRNAIFAEIHMLSHLVGAASRVDLKRIHALEKDKSDLEAKVARQQDRLRSEILRRDGEIDALRRRLDLAEAEHRRLAHAARTANELAGLKAVSAELQRHVTEEEKRRQAAEADHRKSLVQIGDLEQKLAQLAAENDELRAENRLYETRLAGTIADGDRLGACDGDCGRIDLCGRCILFVGGRSEQVQHYRRLVESLNGTFSHHDGGLEENLGRLHGLFGHADAVLFPVDCISHNAHDEVKRLCRRWEKPYLPLRRSGLGAVMRALETLSTVGEARAARA